MARIITYFSALLLLGLLLGSCQKDAGKINKSITDSISTDINALVETEPAIQKPITVNITDAIGGYYAGLPVHYSATTKSYPLLVFIPGGGQNGNGQLDLPDLLNDGVSELLDEKKFPPAFTVNGKTFSMIVVTPQFNSYPSDLDIATFINYIRKNYRIDSTRIYMAGLSMGGFVTSDFSAENTSMIAAAVAISGVLVTGDVTARCEKIAQGKLPLWVFHNIDDPVINSAGSKQFVSLINGDHPVIPARLTLFNAAVHDAWTQAIDPAYKENNMNIYEWMLQYSR